MLSLPDNRVNADVKRINEIVLVDLACVPLGLQYRADEHLSALLRLREQSPELGRRQ